MRLPPPHELGPYASPLVFARVLAQGLHMRRVLPKLPEARGPRSGVTGHGAHVLRLVMVGESSAAGVGANYHRTGLCGGTASALAASLRCRIDWRVYGRSGLTAARALEDVVPTIERESADAIVLTIGANDAMDLTPRDRWQRDLHALLLALRERLGAAPLVIGRAPPFECSPTLPDLLRRFLGFRCRRINNGTAALLPVLERVRLSSEPRHLQAHEFAGDGFHPNESLYARLGAHLAHCLLPMLEVNAGRRSAAHASAACAEPSAA